jgi:hypothetical protein
MYFSNSSLPDSTSIEAAIASIEEAENYFNNQEYSQCATKVAEAALNFSISNTISLPHRAIDIVRACGLIEELDRFRSSLPGPSIRASLGDGYNVGRDPETNRETAEFLLNYITQLVSETQNLQQRE